MLTRDQSGINQLAPPLTELTGVTLLPLDVWRVLASPLHSSVFLRFSGFIVDIVDLSLIPLLFPSSLFHPLLTAHRLPCSLALPLLSSVECFCLCVLSDPQNLQHHLLSPSGGGGGVFRWMNRSPGQGQWHGPKPRLKETTSAFPVTGVPIVTVGY